MSDIENRIESLAKKLKKNPVSDNNENARYIHIRTGDHTEFRVDQKVFARRREYFKKLFQYHTQKEILLLGITGEAMAMIVEFISSGSFERMSPENVLDFLKASDYLMLIENINDSLPNSIHEGNCITLFNGTAALLKNLNHGLHVRDMLSVIRSYIVTKFTVVVLHSNIHDISYRDFKQLVNDDNLCVASEETVWKSIVRWVESHKSARLKRVQSLLHGMRFESCDKQLIEKMINHPMIQQNSRLSSKIRNLMNARRRGRKFLQSRLMSLLGMSRRSTDLPSGRRLQRCAGVRVVPTDSADGVHIAVELFDDPGKSTVVSSLAGFVPDIVFYCGQSVYLFDTASKDAHHAFDLVKKTWTAVPSPKSSRGLAVQHVTFMTVDDRVFASWISLCIEPYAVSASVARYCTETKSWQESFYKYDSTPRLDAGSVQNFNAAAVGNNIITVGRVGEHGEMWHMFSRQYDVNTGLWSHFPFLNFEVDAYHLMSSATCLFIFFQSEECIRWRFHTDVIHARYLSQIIPFFYEVDPSHGVLCLRTIDDHDDSHDHDETKICYNVRQLEQLVDSACPYRRSLSKASFNVTNQEILSSYLKEFSELMWQATLERAKAAELPRADALDHV